MKARCFEGGLGALAEALGIAKSTPYHWNEVVPDFETQSTITDFFDAEPVNWMRCCFVASN